MVRGTFKDKIISILTKCVQMTTIAAQLLAFKQQNSWLKNSRIKFIRQQK